MLLFFSKLLEKAGKYYAANKEVLRENGKISIGACQKKKKIKKIKYQKEIYHMNIDLNEKLKQSQRNFQMNETAIKQLVFFF